MPWMPGPNSMGVSLARKMSAARSMSSFWSMR